MKRRECNAQQFRALCFDGKSSDIPYRHRDTRDPETEGVGMTAMVDMKSVPTSLVAMSVNGVSIYRAG